MRSSICNFFMNFVLTNGMSLMFNFWLKTVPIYLTYNKEKQFKNGPFLFRNTFIFEMGFRMAKITTSSDNTLS